MDPGSGTGQLADVDVVIPLYNAAAFIEAAIRSVLDQTSPPRTIIVVDDGSTDGSGERVKVLVGGNASTTQLKYVHQPNAGPNSARNHGLRLCTSTYTAFLDADDIWMPKKLERQVACFHTSTVPDLLLVYCGARTIDAAGRQKPGTHGLDTSPLRGHVFGELLVKNRITGGSSAVLIKRVCFDFVGPFDEDLRTSEDFDMWLRISQAGSVDLVAEDLVALRDHDRNITKDTMHMLRGMLQFNAKWFSHAWKRPDVLNEWGHLVALFASRAKDRRAARELVNSSLTEQQRRALFSKTFGSLRLYVLLKRARALMNSFGT